MNDYRLVPYAHQLVGIEALVKNPVFALFDEMGAGKSLQVICAAQVLYNRGAIDRVIIICPASVRSVWFDQELGELAKHLWINTPSLVTEYHARVRQWNHGPENQRRLRWIITNYDYIRDETRLDYLKAHCNKQTLLVLDESSAIKNYKAKQTKACMSLRAACGWIWLLNGTPIGNSPADMFSQGRIMNPKILDCKTWYDFRSRYAVMGGWMQKQVKEWINLEDLQRRFAPYVLRRMKVDCLDLPAKLPPVALEVGLTETTWKVYKAMRDEMVAWLTKSTVSVASQAIVKAMRLAQVTSGFIGGVETEDIETEIMQDPLLPAIETTLRDAGIQVVTHAVQEIGREKLDFFLSWLDEQLLIDPKFKCVVFCRFRPELDRLMKSLPDTVECGEIRGGQKKDERDIALRLLDPRTTLDKPIVVGATPGAGSLGLNLTAANVIFRLSNDYSLMKRLQGDDRIHRPGQTRPVSYFDAMAVGPKGQRTIDHVIIKALRDKDAIATWTTQAWVRALRDE